MLVCGEDLGMVADCVSDVMKQLGILSLEIQRMPKDPKKTFFHPNDAPYMSVITPSTHDMSTIRGWWEKTVNGHRNSITQNWDSGAMHLFLRVMDQPGYCITASLFTCYVEYFPVAGYTGNE